MSKAVSDTNANAVDSPRGTAAILPAEVFAQREDPRDILLLALRTGKMMLENGAEVFRVDDTVKRICRVYGIHSARTFVLSSGLFITAGDADEPQFAEVWQVPVNAANLTRVTELNALSRRLDRSLFTVEKFREELDRIEAIPDYPLGLRLLGAGVAAAAFSYMFDGRAKEVFWAFVLGVIFEFYRYFLGGRHLSRITRNILGGGLIAAISLFFWRLGLVWHLEALMIGGIILMVPGVAFTNGIRDLADGDYLSGAIRLLDAVIVFFSIAIGVGTVIALYNIIIGGLS